MGRDLIGVVVFAKDEDEALSKANALLDDLVRKDALWYFYTRDMYDSNTGMAIRELGKMPDLDDAMLINGKESKGYKFVWGLLNGYYRDTFYRKLTELREVMQKRTDEELWKDKDFFRSSLESLADSSIFVHTLYGEDPGSDCKGFKIRTPHDLKTVINMYRKFWKKDDNTPHEIVEMWEKDYRVYVVPALSKT